MSSAADVWMWSGLFLVVAAGLLSGVGYLFREGILRFITTKLTLASQMELQESRQKFDGKIGDVQRNFERIQSTQQNLLASLLDVSSERAKAVSKREIEAVEAIWASVYKLNRLILTAKTAELLNFEEIDKASASDRDRIAKLAAIFSTNLTPEFMESINCHWTRLYVNESAWAFYNAYSTILLSAGLRMMAVESGLPVSKTFDKTVLNKAIVEALPHQKPTLDKYPDMASSIFLDELREVMVRELKRSIRGEQSTEQETERARAILDALPNEIPNPSER